MSDTSSTKMRSLKAILIKGNNKLCNEQCVEPQIYFKNKYKPDPEYKFGDEAMSIYNQCFSSIPDGQKQSCRVCWYKLDSDEKKRKAMLRKPIDKRKGQKYVDI